MARTESRIKTAIWSDDDFLALPSRSQRAFLLLISQQTINLCGVLAFTPRKWASFSSDETVRTVRASLRELEQRKFIVIDEATEELWVRTFIKHDHVADNDRTYGAALGQLSSIVSRRIRTAATKALHAAREEKKGVSTALPKALPDSQSDTECDSQADRDRVSRAHTPASSSSLQPPTSAGAVSPTGEAPTPATSGGGGDVFEEAIELLAQREFERRLAEGPRIGDKVRWLKSVRAGLRTRHSDLAGVTLSAHPEMSGLLLADWLEPPAKSGTNGSASHWQDTQAAAAKQMRDMSERDRAEAALATALKMGDPLTIEAAELDLANLDVK